MKKIFWLLPILIVIAGVVFVIVSMKPPQPTVTVGGERVAVVQGSYCWRDFIKEECATMEMPQHIMQAQGVAAVNASPNEKIDIQFTKEPLADTVSTSVSYWDGTVATVAEDTTTVPAERGVYVYTVSASWDEGKASYSFAVEVQ